MSHSGLSRQTSYNNRFRTSSGGGGDNDNDTATTTATTTDRPLQLHSVSEMAAAAVDLFGHSPHFGQPSPQGPTRQAGQRGPTEQNNEGHASQTVTTSGCQYGEVSWDGVVVAGTAAQPGGRQQGSVPVPPRQSSVGSDASRPTAPGKPRRLSRQTSADAKRQQFAASRTASGGCGGGGSGSEAAAGRHAVTSVDSGCDDVFVDVAAGGGGEPGFYHHQHHSLHDSSLFPNKRPAEATFSTSSTASILPNPYNRINHRIHSCIWCCSCLYFVFFCCLPAIHFMEQSDVEFNRNNQKRARGLGRASSFLFFTGSLVTLSMFALIFFLAIFFTAY